MSQIIIAEQTYSDESLLQNIIVSVLDVTNRDLEGSDLDASGLSEYSDRTLLCKLATPIQGQVKIGLEDLEFAQMPVVLTTTDGLNHEGFFLVPGDGSHTLYIKIVDVNGNPFACSLTFALNVNSGPIGEDAENLLRLRKFFKNGSAQRWDGLRRRTIA